MQVVRKKLLALGADEDLPVVSELDWESEEKHCRGSRGVVLRRWFVGWWDVDGGVSCFRDICCFEWRWGVTGARSGERGGEIITPIVVSLVCEWIYGENS